jgi:hypothetical protein
MRIIDMEEAAIVSRWPVLLRLVWWVLTLEVWTLRRGKTVLVLHGVKSMEEHQDGLGCIWQLATHDAELPWNKPHVYAVSAAFVEDCQRRFPVLGNAVYAKNAKALRFVKRLGFIVQPAIVVHGALFHPIARSACVESSRQ